MRQNFAFKVYFNYIPMTTEETLPTFSADHFENNTPVIADSVNPLVLGFILVSAQISLTLFALDTEDNDLLSKRSFAYLLGILFQLIFIIFHALMKDDGDYSPWDSILLVFYALNSFIFFMKIASRFTLRRWIIYVYIAVITLAHLFFGSCLFIHPEEMKIYYFSIYLILALKAVMFVLSYFKAPRRSNENVENYELEDIRLEIGDQEDEDSIGSDSGYCESIH